jgi:TRAP transporter TAXI family solute receptor
MFEYERDDGSESRRGRPRRRFIFLLVLVIIAAAWSMKIWFDLRGTFTIASAPPADPTYDIADGICRFLQSKARLKLRNRQSEGSVENAAGLRDQLFASAIVESCIAGYALEGKAMFSRPIRNLKGIASLFPQALHIVTSGDMGIESIDQLKGRRISMGFKGSSMEHHAKKVLNAAGIGTAAVKLRYLGLEDSIEGLKEKDIDAFFLMAAYPVKAIAQIPRMTLLPLDENMIRKIIGDDPYYLPAKIPPAAYRTESNIFTVGAVALWVTDQSHTEEYIYRLTKAFWENKKGEFFFGFTRLVHPREIDIRKEWALRQMTVPLHPGAERWYREMGMLESWTGKPK